MWSKLTQSVVVTGSLVLAACGGGHDGAALPRQQRPEGSVATTTPAAPAIDLSRPIPGGSLHGTPRPPLENTGTDYVAITTSLIAQMRWLAENPDPRLIADLWVPGTAGHDDRVGAYEYLVANGYRWADQGYELLKVELVDARFDVASLRVTDRMDFERLVDRIGSQVGTDRYRVPSETTWTALLSLGLDERWRIADATVVETSIAL